MAVNKNNYHITIKNLRTGILHGFMLAGGDTPYMVQGVDNIAQRIQDGEILYSDFTNSRVFAQENWSEGTTKFWDPEKNWYYIFPSRKYKDKKSIRILNNGSEFTLWSKLSEVYTYTNPQLKWPMCRGESWWVVYMWDGMKLYRSSDYGTTWSIFKDFTAEKYLTGIVNEITDIKLISTVAPFTMSYTWEMASMTLATMKQIWVCFYNRSTKHTEVARYDIDYWIKWFSGSTFKKSYSGTINAAFWSKRDTLKVDTTIPIEEIQWFLHQYTYNSSTKTFFFVSSWTAASNKLFPWQKFKARRNATWAIYNCTVMSWWWWFNSGWSSPTEMNISWIPSFSSTSAENYYTIYDIWKTGSLCLPITEWWIESIVAVWLWLWQTFDYMWERFFIDWLSNGIKNFGNQIGNFTETYQPAGSIVATDYAIISKVWWWDYIDIALSNWWFTKIDKEDLEKVRNNLWYKTIRNSVESRIWDTLVKLHRLVMWSKDSSPIDHINRDTTDNRKINLRLCTQSENNRNIWKKKNWTSKYKYVYKHSSIWIWRVSYKWKKYYKSFKYELDAALWADWLVNSFWDKFKTTNKSLWLL